ncbi:MAG: hypothetical protein RLN88_00130 [Ekhidna sp.]|uniref:hypothetical protein n=1 Tax=Ekhidna sp. TaxID=2608089 RepID=UPI0032EBEFA8
MKSLRYILISVVIGGAFGAKAGAFLSTLLESQVPGDFIEFGFVAGSLSCAFVTAIFLIITSAGASQSTAIFWRPLRMTSIKSNH